MTREDGQSFVDGIVALLVKQFGSGPVRRALDKVADEDDSGSRSRRRPRSASSRAANPPIPAALAELRQVDEERHALLNAFYDRLRAKTVLPEPQDIRQFAQLVGLKEVRGKSRKDMITGLMRFLLNVPTERLRLDLEAANNVSEDERRKGFSVLTDRLLGEPSTGT